MQAIKCDICGKLEVLDERYIAFEHGEVWHRVSLEKMVGKHPGIFNALDMCSKCKAGLVSTVMNWMEKNEDIQV